MSVIDADVVAREVVAPGTPGLAAVTARFGPAVLDASGALDRQALATTVFADDAARRDLEAIVHPEVYASIENWFAGLSAPIGIADIPLLFETKHQADFDAVVVVACTRDEQRARLRLRGLSDDEARQRLESQLPIEDKVRRADFVIDTSGSAADTDRQVTEVWEKLKLRRAARQP